uniref:RING-type domain-containing protein n=2 Tax=Arion vulgaris TaxID=1028688 RepID=A0A0B7B3D2_9EUPU
MMEFVKNTEDEIETLAKRFPKNIKEGLMKRVFIISHPHGREKVMSYGEYVMVKYALKVGQEQEQPKIEMQRINNHTQISENHNDIRKILLYTAETCKGSSGAVVISFKKTKHNNDEDIVLDLWMHSGMCKINGLNASVMRELTNEDIANHSNPNTFRPSVQDELEQEADNAANQVVSCPLYTVMGAPTHPAYVTYQKRLDSYISTFHHVHTAAELADAGFFCAGYADCVRCFHCGLGLRSWKPGDNIYEEHRKNRSDCQFLQMKLKAAGIHQTESHNFQQGARSQVSAQQQAAASSTNENQQNHPPKFTMVVQTSEPSVTQSSQKESGMLNNQTEMMEQTMNPVPSDQHKITVGMVLCNQAEAGNPAVPQITSVNILEKEQHYLKQILTCKVCSRNQVKDLFLPCGELVACLECSKLLTHCPSCNTKILATITTYFS